MRSVLYLAILTALACRTENKDLVDSGPPAADDTAAVDDTASDDLDGDGHGAAEAGGGDCDDSDASVNPDADEIPYDGIDNDCDEATPDDDLDGDGHGAAEGDCDDGDASVNPDAVEVCNDLDDDCDGEIDDAVGDAWYADGDGDGYGDPARATQSCEAATGYVADASDCDDGDDDTWPGADEVCDGEDNDCDSAVDEDATDAATWHNDADADGFGDDASAVDACAQPTGHVSLGGDCDDGDAAASPAGAEICDGVDNDCDGDTDEPDAHDAADWYADADADGYGDPGSSTTACDAPSGYVADASDCDDGSADHNPGADEVCDSDDDDCDGSVDEDAADAATWYADADADGYGDPGAAYTGCDPSSGYVSDASDCDDGDDATHPAADEVCDLVDNDCDGATDEDDAVDAATWYADDDSDGYGADATTACYAPDGYADADGDCDDAAPGVYPGAEETCDDADEDCDGSVDEGASDAPLWYADADADGYGDPDDALASCDAPSGYVADASDCDDGDAGVYPGADETCDDADDDCDGAVDEDASDAATWYLDYDGDGFGGDAFTATGCDPLSGYVETDTDCDDLDADVNPSASEVCDGADDDCDGAADEGFPAGIATWYADADSDGYGDPDASAEACDAPSGYVEDASDCDDGDATSYPDGTEVCDGADNDCDGEVDDSADLLGSDDACPAESCLDIVTTRSDPPDDGYYWIDPTGSDTFEAYCEMSTEGGGWTLIANLSDSDDDNWSQFMPTQDAGLWESADTHGDGISFTADYKSEAYIDLPATDLLIVEDAAYNVLVTESCWSEQPFVDFIAGLAWEGDGSDYTWDDGTGAWICAFEHFGYTDTVLRAGSHASDELELAFKWGERDGVQDGNKDRTMITTYDANGYTYPHHVDLPTGLGGFTSYSGAENYEDNNECQGDGPDRCTNSDQNYQLFVR